MTDLRKAAEMALETLWVGANDAVPNDIDERFEQAIEALRQALAQPVDAVNMSQERVDETAKGEHEPYDQQALELCEKCGWKAIIPDEGCLVCARNEQEPVGYAHVEDLKREHHDFWVNREQGVNEVPLYTAPPQKEEGCAQCGKQASQGWALYCVECVEGKREWVGLTDEEIWDISVDNQRKGGGFWGYPRALEAKLKEKNT